MAVCLLLVVQIPQIARFTKCSITLEVIPCSLRRNLLWYVQGVMPILTMLLHKAVVVYQTQQSAWAVSGTPRLAIWDDVAYR